MYQILGII